MVNNHSSKQGDMRPAFTMIELVFVIVILGILAAVAIPKLAANRDDAILVKGKSQVSAIRSGIALQKSKNMLSGLTSIPAKLDDVVNYGEVDNERLFNFSDGNSTNILEYPIYSGSKDGSWFKSAQFLYDFKLANGLGVVFTYNPATGSFDCDRTDALTGKDCASLTQ
ncbi:MAG: prepilin-type N-terminal cleavage/methylation domain-containing protein [Sulfurospirillaceae bacterium]|nr:prepilin-type N-terminal cleavage/methylation domain-containing protein [Sulfurospirillaceae bacterium]